MPKKVDLTKHQKLTALGILCLGGIISSLILLAPNPFDSASQAASKINTPLNCSGESQFRCYASHYANITYYNSPAAAFGDLKTRYEQDEYVKRECHQLVHIIGRTALKLYKTIAASYPKGDSFCWSGYYHGVTEQAIGDIGATAIKSQTNTLCAALSAQKKYSFEHYNCVHGLGHGFMAMDGYELFNALETCDLLNDDWEKSSCHGGVYMENVMVAVRENGYSKYLKEDNPLYPCNAVETKYKEQCYLMQSSYALQKNGYDFSKTFQLCAEADEAFKNTCYQSIGRDASGSTSSDITRTKTNCDFAHSEVALKNCMVGAVKDFIAYHDSLTQAKQLCDAFGGELTSECDQIATNYYRTF